jgi:hypothetical protein
MIFLENRFPVPDHALKTSEGTAQRASAAYTAG